MLTKKWLSLVIYIVSVGVLIVLGYILWFIARTVALDVVRLQDHVDRSTYSTLESLLGIGIYVGSPILAVPITRWIVKRLNRRQT
jgi:hypothetical protein